MFSTDNDASDRVDSTTLVPTTISTVKGTEGTTEQRFTMTTEHKNRITAPTSIIYPQIIYDAFGNEIHKEDNSYESTTRFEFMDESVENTQLETTTTKKTPAEEVLSEDNQPEGVETVVPFKESIALDVSDSAAAADCETTESEQQPSSLESTFETVSVETTSLSEKTTDISGESTTQSSYTSDNISSRDSTKISTNFAQEQANTNHLENIEKLSTISDYHVSPQQTLTYKNKPSQSTASPTSFLMTQSDRKNASSTAIPAASETTVIPLDILDEDIYDIYDYYEDLLDQDFLHLKSSTVKGPDIAQIFHQMAQDSMGTTFTNDVNETFFQQHTDSPVGDVDSQNELQTFYPDLESNAFISTKLPDTVIEEKNKPFSTLPDENSHMPKSTTILMDKVTQKPYFPTNSYASLKTKTPDDDYNLDPQYTTIPFDTSFLERATTVTVNEILEDSTKPDSNQKTTVITIDNHRPPPSTTQANDLKIGYTPTAGFSENIYQYLTTEKTDTDTPTAHKTHPSSVVTTVKSEFEKKETTISVTDRPTIKYPFPTIHMKHTTKYPVTPEIILQQEAVSESYKPNLDSQLQQQITFSDMESEQSDIFTSPPTSTPNLISETELSEETVYDVNDAESFIHDSTETEQSENSIDDFRSTVAETQHENLPIAEKWSSNADNTQENSLEQTSETFVEMTQSPTPITTQQTTTVKISTTDKETTTTFVTSTEQPTTEKTEVTVTEKTTTAAPTTTSSATTTSEQTTVTIPTTTEIDLSSADFREGKINVYKEMYL